MSQPFSLIGLDIGGDWNRPLLANAAAISGCSCIFARSEVPDALLLPNESAGMPVLEVALREYRYVIACERIRGSTSVFDLPTPRAATAVIVGNEDRGISRKVIKQADAVACVPMASHRLSSLNVAVAASIILYALTHDFGRKHRRRARLNQSETDVLVHAPADPHELGSLLRSVYAFGWRRVYVSDPHGVWFTEDPQTILAGRAAARRANNLLAVLPASQLDPLRYDATVVGCERGEGIGLSKLCLPECQRLLVEVGRSNIESGLGIPTTRVSVDHENRAEPACFRHTGSILLSVISQMFVA